jgi:type IV secretion system protein VirB4
MIHVTRRAALLPPTRLRVCRTFLTPVTDAIDQERRELFQSLGTMYEGYLSLPRPISSGHGGAKVCRADV